MKTCTKCGLEKQEDDFSFRYKLKNVRLSQCKVCMAANNKQHYLNNSQLYKNLSRLRKQELTSWYKGFKSSLKCNRCGFSNPAALQFHHESSETKEFGIASMISQGASRTAIIEEIQKCEVLCANCHLIHHHGTGFES